MVVPIPTKATAAQIHNIHTHMDESLGNGLAHSSRTGGTESERAGPPVTEGTASNGSTPGLSPRAAARGDLREERYEEAEEELDGRTLLRENGNGTMNPRTEREPQNDRILERVEQTEDRSRTTPRAQAAQGSGKRAEENERKTSLQVAALNMNGFGNLIRDHEDNKWGRIYRMMSDNKLGVLMLQETHLTKERKEGLHKMFARKVKIFHSEHPNAPTQREGVAIVLNARYLNTAEASATEIVPGRALQVSIPCLGGDTRILLCVYAPTSSGVEERRSFFKTVCEYYETHPTCPKPHVMAGDFNCVEDSLDRLPVSETQDSSVLALDELKISLGLMFADGWRATYPSTKEYTFHRGVGREAVFSRLDRIYVSPDVFDNAREWRIREAGVKTDHSLVSVQLTTANAPIIGPGRPLFPLLLLKDRILTKRIKERGLRAMVELTNLTVAGTRNDSLNPQTVLHSFKTDIMRLARTREKDVVPKLMADIREGETTLRRLKADKNLSEEAKLTEAAALTKHIRQLKRRRYRQQQQNSRATHRLYGDRPTKYWSKLHRECAPRDVITAFEKEGMTGTSGEKVYETDSTRMAEMARRHHMNIQKDDATVKPPEERELDIGIALDSIETEVTMDQANGLGEEITYDEVEQSLRLSKSGAAPGLDGTPFELWKTLHARFIEDKRFPDRTSFDVVRLLKEAFEDIRTFGVCSRTGFAHGWIAPIYKEKGERTRVVNYRPITILNTDYKLLSKALAIRLAAVAPDIINRAQAGFVPGRKIRDHTQLARVMMAWAETNEQDGAIVALDQEKAYDKIAHDYLWRVLERFRVPESFIQLIKSLYNHAVTSIMVNGVLSKAYYIYRGVRQGDPLSCLLFDLAIEPLSAMIRKSTITGFDIPRCNEVLKAVLFADDTTVYLSSKDDFSVLQKLLDTWCSAAKAKFNMSKTEIIPIGGQDYRREMADTYRDTGVWKNYPAGVHVAQEGEAVRILGAFFGNGVEQVNVWTLVLNKIVAMRPPLMQVLARWKAGHATIYGKKHVVQMVIGGITQYLTTVQRMPQVIRDRLNKVMRAYLWDDRHNTPVGSKHLYLPVEQGGIGLLDLKARSEAIDVMWLKAYLDFSENRPIWAYLVDDLLSKRVPKHCRPHQADLRINTFTQTWKPRSRGFPEEVQGMLRVAKKYGVRLEGLAFSRTILKSLPMWDHKYADRKRLGRLTHPSKLLNCLQMRHKAKTVGDFVNMAELLRNATHEPRASCVCDECGHWRSATQCENPHLCASRARDMVDTLPSKWNPRRGQPEDYERDNMEKLKRETTDTTLVPFDRSVTTYGDLGHAFRIFTDAEETSNDGALMEIDEVGPLLTVATDGSCIRNGEKDAQAGAGVFAEENHPLNSSIRLPSWVDQSNQAGEIVATLMAATTVEPNRRVIQETDSRTTMDSLTNWKQRHEDTGYILQKNAYLTKATLAKLRMRKAHTLFKWVKGHNGHPRNEAADKLSDAESGSRTGR